MSGLVVFGIIAVAVIGGIIVFKDQICKSVQVPMLCDMGNGNGEPMVSFDLAPSGNRGCAALCEDSDDIPGCVRECAKNPANLVPAGMRARSYY